MLRSRCYLAVALRASFGVKIGWQQQDDEQHKQSCLCENRLQETRDAADQIRSL